MQLDTLENKKIEKLIIEKQKEISNLYFDIKSGDLSNLDEYRKLKKEIARMHTILKERELGLRKVVEVKKVEKKTKTKKTTSSSKKTKKTKDKK